MGRVDVVITLIVVVLDIWALVSCILTPDSEVRHLPKIVWILLIIILTPLGGILWLVIGRDRVRTVRSAAPDDDPRFLGNVDNTYRSPASLREQDERIRKLEEELARLDSETDDDGGATPRRV